MADEYKAQLNAFWVACVDDGLRVDLGSSEVRYIDPNIWAPGVDETTIKVPKPDQPVGYEMQPREIVTVILYKEDTDYFVKTVTEKIYDFKPELIPP